jgi:hypothetical protein
MLADATQGGIPLGISALEMTRVERKATMEILKEIREKQKPKK